MKKKLWIMIPGVLACVGMCLIETVLRPEYFVKSILKIALFFGTILLYCAVCRVKISEALNLKKPVKAKSLLIFIGIAYVTVLAAFFICKNFINLSNIQENLLNKEGLTKQNCIFVFAYIIVCNSFLEESFFRGYLFHGLSENKPLAYLFSSFLFAVYHIGIVDGWFNFGILLVCILGLMIAGMFLSYVSERYRSLLANYIVHGTANLAINTIGIYMIFFM